MAGSGQLTMPVVMMSGHGTIDSAVEATRIGAFDFLEKPISLPKLLATVGKALATVKNVDTLIVGHSPLRTIPELREYQQFMNEFVAAVRDAKQSGKSVDDGCACTVTRSPFAVLVTH